MIIKSFDDGTQIEIGRGRFDDNCVYLIEPYKRKIAPRDVDYFRFFIEKSKCYSSKKIYEDFVIIYDKTTDKVDNMVLQNIEEISKSYNADDRRDFCVWFTVIYLGMIAEEKKKNAVLKKRIKRLGMYQILFEGFDAYKAANFSKGKKVPELSSLCIKKGF